MIADRIKISENSSIVSAKVRYHLLPMLSRHVGAFLVILILVRIRDDLISNDFLVEEEHLKIQPTLSVMCDFTVPASL